MTASNEGGLGLFDETASAVGNFPGALRGYDRSAVDDYVRSLEGRVVQTRRRVGSLEQQVTSLNDQLRESVERQRAQEVDFTNLGGRATEILRLAEEQAREVADRAIEEAERTKEHARREADRLREEAVRAGSDIKASGIAEIEKLRGRGQTELQQQVEHARAEAAGIVGAARREAEAVQRAAEHEAQTLRQNAYLDTEKLRREVEREAADIRAGIASEREAALDHLKSVHDEAVAKTAALLAEATAHHHAATERLEADIAEATRIRGEALAEAEQLKLAAAREAEERVVAARKQAAAITERTQQEFSWRKQQLRRETDLLGQRKAAVLNQLASLSALAEQTAHSFPEMEELDGFDAEQGDHTVLMPPSAGPALPRTDVDQPKDDAPAAPGSRQTSEQERPAGNQAAESQPPRESQRTAEAQHAAESRAASDGEPADESATDTRVLRAVTDADTEPTVPNEPVGRSGDSSDEDTMEIDGDATVLVPPSQLPAGTQHLRGGADPKQG